MKEKPTFLLSGAIALVISLLSLTPVHGQEYKALEGLESINSVIDFRKDNPKEAAAYLHYIHQTYMYLNTSFSENADLVIVFTGPVVKLLSTNSKSLSAADSEILDQIAETVASMGKDGIRMEICLFACKLSGIELETILPEIKQVENGWVSLLGYQAKDYSLLPIY